MVPHDFCITYYEIWSERAENNILIKENFITIFLFQEILLCQISVLSLIAAYPQYLESKSVTFCRQKYVNIWCS